MGFGVSNPPYPRTCLLGLNLLSMMFELEAPASNIVTEKLFGDLAVETVSFVFPLMGI